MTPKVLGSCYQGFLNQVPTFPSGSKDSYFKAFGPNDPTVLGFWAILRLSDVRAFRGPGEVEASLDRLGKRPLGFHSFIGTSCMN